MQLLAKLQQGQGFAKLLLAPELPVEHGMKPLYRDAESLHSSRQHSHGTPVDT